MGLFGLGRQKKTYTLDQAIEAVRVDLERIEARRKEELYTAAVQIYAHFREMRTLIGVFSKSPVPVQAKRSENVKERFCRIADEQLADLSPPQKDNPAAFITTARVLINGLGGLTERQLLHFGVFFKDQIVPLGRKMTEINRLLEVRSSAAEHARAIKLYTEMENMGKQKVAYEQQVTEKSALLKSLEKKLDAVSLPSEHVDSSAIVVADKELRKIKQEIDSLLSVQKMLKRYMHDTGVKDALLQSYIDSPSTAILKDESLSIVSIVKDARKFDDTGKAESVVSRESYLKTKRTELISAMRMAEEEKKRYEQKSAEAAARAMESRRKIASMEMEIKDCRRFLDDARTELEKSESRIAEHRREAAHLASKILNAEIV